MSDDIKNRTDQLKDELYGAIDTVSAALESGEEKAQLDAGKAIEPLIEKFQQLYNDIPVDQRRGLDPQLSAERALDAKARRPVGEIQRDPHPQAVVAARLPAKRELI